MRSAIRNLKRSNKANALGSAAVMATRVFSGSQFMAMTGTKKVAFAVQILMLARTSFALARSARTRLRILNTHFFATDTSALRGKPGGDVLPVHL